MSQHPLSVELHSSCLVCRGQGPFTPRVEAWPLAVVECPACGFLFTSPRYTEASLNQLYASSYHTYQGDDAYGFYRTGSLGRERYNWRVLSGLAPLRRVLDVGCAQGIFLEAARESSRDAELHGFDLDPALKAAIEARVPGAHVFVGQGLKDVALQADGYDLVMLNDVLEHLSEPRRVLVEIRRLLRPWGLLACRVPNTGYLMAKHRILPARATRNSGDPPLSMDFHLSHFTLASVSSLLRQEGFELESSIPGLSWRSGNRIKDCLKAAQDLAARACVFASGGAVHLGPAIMTIWRKPRDSLNRSSFPLHGKPRDF
jgi:SAM-dependent methyltransferase